MSTHTKTEHFEESNKKHESLASPEEMERARKESDH